VEAPLIVVVVVLCDVVAAEEEVKGLPQYLSSAMLIHPAATLIK
jgi:hypothetical protein